MIGVSAFVNLPLHHKVQKFSSGSGSPGWSWKKGRKTLVCVNVELVEFASCVTEIRSVCRVSSARLSAYSAFIISVRLLLDR